MLADLTIQKFMEELSSGSPVPVSYTHLDVYKRQGMTSARKARMILENLISVLGIELMCAAQAVEFQGSRGLSPAGRAVYETVRKEVAPLEEDRVLYPDMEACARLIRDGLILKAAEETIGPLE